MHVILEKITAGTSAMSIKDSKIAAFRPATFVIGFGDVHDNRDSIFVIVFNESVKGIDRVTFDEAVAFLDEIGVVEFWNLDVLLRLMNWFHG